MAADTYNSLSSDLRIPAYLTSKLRELLREKTDLRMLMEEISFDGTGSAGVKSGAYQVDAPWTAPGEDTASSPENIVDSSATLTVAHYRLERQLTDMAEYTGGPGMARLAQDMSSSSKQHLSKMMTALFENLSQTVGSTGVNLSLANWYSAMYLNQLNLLGGEEIFAVLHPQQYNDLHAAIAAETGGLLASQGDINLLYAKTGGYKGKILGVETFTHNSVATVNTGADRCGAMFGRGCFGFTELDPRPFAAKNPAFIAAPTDGSAKIAVEYQRGGSNGKQLIIGHYFPAVAELEDLRGVAIETDA